MCNLFGVGQYQFLGKITTKFPHFQLLTPLLHSNEDVYVLQTPHFTFLLQPPSLLTHSPFNQSHLLLENTK